VLDAAHAGLTTQRPMLMGGGDELAVVARYVILVAAADVSVLAEQGSRLRHNNSVQQLQLH